MGKSIAEMLVDTITDIIIKHPAYPVISGGQARLIQAGMEPREAWNVSRGVLVEFLRDEGVKFGNPAYAWDAAAGATLVEEYEIAHWEAA